MAHFYGDMQGNRGQCSRLGTKNSGIDAHIRGWNLGGKVYVAHNPQTGKDRVEFRVTGGSNNATVFRLDLMVTETDDGWSVWVNDKRREDLLA